MPYFALKAEEVRAQPSLVDLSVATGRLVMRRCATIVAARPCIGWAEALSGKCHLVLLECPADRYMGGFTCAIARPTTGSRSMQWPGHMWRCLAWTSQITCARACAASPSNAPTRRRMNPIGCREPRYSRAL